MIDIEGKNMNYKKNEYIVTWDENWSDNKCGGDKMSLKYCVDCKHFKKNLLWSNEKTQCENGN